MYNAENKTARLSSGAEVYYAKFGKGKRVLVMIPGLNIIDMNGTALNLAYFYRKFTKEFTVYIFDRRSGRDEGATIQSMADDLAEAMAKVGITDAYVLGVSQGGMIAQYLAADHPEPVKKLILGVTAPKPYPATFEALSEWIGFAEKGDLKGILTKSYDRMYTEAQMKKYKLLIPVMMKFTKFMSIERFIDHAKAIYTMDIGERLNKIKCPVLVIGAEHDRITTAEGARELAERLGCECFMFQNEGHAAYLSDEFNRMVYEFFSA